MSEESDKNLDYTHLTSVANVHSSVKREKEEPRAGLEPVSIWTFIVVAVILVSGGAYLGAFTQFGNLDSIYAQPNYEWTPPPVDEGGDAVQLAWIDKWMKDGASKFGVTCGACHGSQGEGKAVNGIPPLDGSEWVTGGTERLAQIVMKGLKGPITVKGESYGAVEMQAPLLSDREYAQVLTYVRRTFGSSDASVVTQEMMASARANYGSRTTPWTVGELAPANAMLEGVEIDEQTGEPLGAEPAVAEEN
ncbi:MAG: mono/diheme cytochrome c family protein [Verrucomicrobiales bacterium]|jgi:mono/diheme cytochrome c family protein